ncbi:hypothetical protein evm_010573 [Chilo suppressalis]|nr:hypothetical protein evm_010573 [Chilo suppressalis]
MERKSSQYITEGVVSQQEQHYHHSVRSGHLRSSIHININTVYIAGKIKPQQLRQLAQEAASRNITSCHNTDNNVSVVCVEKVLREALAGLRPLLCSEDMEVQERAHNAHALLELVLRQLSPADEALLDHQSNGLDTELVDHEMNGEDTSSKAFSGGLIEELVDLFDGELKPVAPKAQKKVPMPADLDLDQWMSRERWSSDSSSSEDEGEGAVFAAPAPDPRPTAQFTPEELQMLREARRQEQANNPHYLKDDSPRSYQQEDIPIAEIALEVPLQIHTKRSDKYLITRDSAKKTKKEKRSSKKRKSKKAVHSSESESEERESGRTARPAWKQAGSCPKAPRLRRGAPAPPDDPHRALDLRPRAAVYGRRVYFLLEYQLISILKKVGLPHQKF